MEIITAEVQSPASMSVLLSGKLLLVQTEYSHQNSLKNILTGSLSSLKGKGHHTFSTKYTQMIFYSSYRYNTLGRSSV